MSLRKMLPLIIMFAGLPAVVRAQADCKALTAGPERTDCYIGLSRTYQGQSDIAAAKARVRSDAARNQQITGSAVPNKRRRCCATAKSP